MNDFLDHSAASTRYGMFSPMEVQIIFHFAGRGNARQRLSLLDFAQLLDPDLPFMRDVISSIKQKQKEKHMPKYFHQTPQ